MKKVYSINFFIIFSITSLIISGCSTIDITRQDIDYVKKVNSEIDSLQFPNDKENEIWAKIQLFLSEYSNARIQIISPEHIETYQVEPLVYYITKVKYYNHFDIIIKVKTIGYKDYNLEEFNKKALIHYLLTNEANQKIIGCNLPECRNLIADPNNYKSSNYDINKPR